MCVLGSINEHYEGSVNYGQTVGVFVFYPETEWVNLVLRILNLEGKQNCIFSSKVTTILQPLFQKKSNTSNVGMCLSKGNRLEYCTAHSDFIFCEHF